MCVRVLACFPLKLKKEEEEAEKDTVYHKPKHNTHWNTFESSERQEDHCKC